MSIVNRLIDDHRALARVADELGAMVARDAMPDPAALAACRWNLARLVTAHLALEDKHVYGPLDAQGATPAGKVARRLKRELGDLSTAFQRHIRVWPGDAVMRDWHGYRAAVRALLTALRGRIEREEAELYPLLPNQVRIAT